MTRLRFVPLTICALLLAPMLIDVAESCLLADRLRIIAPHLTEDEVMALAHGSMDRTVIPYDFGGPSPCVGGMADIFPCDNVDLVAFMTLASIGGGSGNDIWGWTDPLTGREYALMGRTHRHLVRRRHDPDNPVYLGNLPHPAPAAARWRDIKVYADHAFIVSEARHHGMQVFDLTQLRGVAAPPVTFAETAHYAGFGSAHNIVINEDTGFAYAVGTDTCGGGLAHDRHQRRRPAPVSAGCFIDRRLHPRRPVRDLRRPGCRARRAVRSASTPTRTRSPSSTSPTRRTRSSCRAPATPIAATPTRAG